MFIYVLVVSKATTPMGPAEGSHGGSPRQGPSAPDHSTPPSPSCSVCWRVLRATNAAIDRVRVELHGAYTYERLRDLETYEQRTASRPRAALVALLTPVPSFAVLATLDALPLAPPRLGLHAQTAWFWVRVALVACSTACIAILTMSQAVPALPMSPRRLGVICMVITLVLLPFGYGLGRLIGFPIPFVLQLETPLWATLVLGAAYVSWKDTVYANATVRHDLERVRITLYAVIAMIVVYTAFSCIFTQLTAHEQAVASCLLPVLKIAFKNWIDRGISHAPHLRPVYSVFNIDIFHTMFVASAMQQTASGAALLVVVVVDLAQNVVAVIEVAKVVHAVQKIQNKRTTTALGPLAYALHILESSDTVRHRVSIARVPSRNEIIQAAKAMSRPRKPVGPVSVVPLGYRGTNPRAAPDKRLVAEDLETAIAQSVLKILYMTEFYVLTEYVESTVAIIYGLYLYTLSYLPNRVYYTQLASLTADELRSKAHNVLLYATYELFSCLVFCLAVDRMMDHFSLIGQLGFVLEKHLRIVQMFLVFWVLFVVQSTLEHLGTDYTFQFSWLRTPN